MCMSGNPSPDLAYGGHPLSPPHFITTAVFTGPGCTVPQIPQLCGFHVTLGTGGALGRRGPQGHTLQHSTHFPHEPEVPIRKQGGGVWMSPTSYGLSRLSSPRQMHSPSPSASTGSQPFLFKGCDTDVYKRREEPLTANCFCFLPGKTLERKHRKACSGSCWTWRQGENTGRKAFIAKDGPSAKYDLSSPEQETETWSIMPPVPQW